MKFPERPTDAEYYARIKKKRIIRPFHFGVRNTLVPVMYVMNGRFILDTRKAEGVEAPGVLATTHRSYKDIPYTERAARAIGLSPVRFMYKAEYRDKGLSIVFEPLGGFAVRRSDPRLLSLNHVQSAYLDRGDSVSIYPEGTRRTHARGFNTRKVIDLTRGASQTAIRKERLLVPFALAGVADDDTGRVVVGVFEEPIEPMLDASTPLNRRADLMTSELEERLQTALDRAYEIRDAA